MKINVEVDLADFYSEEEAGSFNDQIKDYIVSQVKYEVMNNFREKGLEQIKNTTISHFDKNLNDEIEKIISDLIKNKKLKKTESSKSTELITIEEFFQERLEQKYFSPDSILDNMLYRKIKDFEDKVINDVAKRSEAIAKELKDRYDMLFASQIVNNLNKQGMLKEDIAKLLLTESR